MHSVVARPRWCSGVSFSACDRHASFEVLGGGRSAAKIRRMSSRLTLVWIALYFLLLLLTLRWSSKIIRGPWLFLLRAFFPNWKFFHAVGYVPHLYVRHLGPDASWADWHWVYPRRTRRLWHLVHNTDVNLALAEQNLLDHFANDLNDLPEGEDARQLVTYQLVDRLVRFDLDRRLGAGAWQGYQFEVRMERSNAQGIEATETMLRSPECTA